MSVATALSRAFRGSRALLAAGALGLAFAGEASAQGVTTGAVRGRVTDQAGQAVAGATLFLVNEENGNRFTGYSTADGGYFIANVLLGPYTVEARAIGYRPSRQTNVVVRLGQVAQVDLRVEAATVELTPITVAGAAENTLLAPNRTGPVALVGERTIENLPSINRNFTDFTATNSLVNSTSGGTGVSVAGQSDRFNNLQIDGGTNSDLFGLNATRGTPGGRNGSRPLSIEAVQEYQVLIAPFDVRQGGFTGGLINAVTKSGTNTLHGSLFGYYQDNSLTGKDTTGQRAGEFNLRYYGFTLGGPIIRDRLHFFVATEWRSQESPFGGPNIGTDTTGGADSVNIGIRRATAERVRQYTINTLGFDPGDFGPATIPNPDRNLFAKLTAQLGSRSQAELSFNHVNSSQLNLLHSSTGANPTRLRDGYEFNASGYNNDSKTNSLRARLNTPFGRQFTNELIVSYNYIQDVRNMANRRPLLIVGADRGTPPTTFLALGGERFSQANLLNQKVLEIANNLTIDLGRSHVVTVGGRYERFKFLNVFFPASLGAWFFPDTTAFFNNAPTRYELALPGSFLDPVNGRTDGPIADFTFSQFGLYAQDQFTPTRGLSLSYGARFDFTKLPRPAYNPFVDTVTALTGPLAGQPFGIRTDNTPTNALLISPRVGFNYDLSSDRSAVIRGGVGIFSGRTPYVWASNAYTNTGLEQVQLTCTTTNGVPTFSADPDNQPTACLTGGLSAATPSIVYFDKNFKLPQNFRASLGLDRTLPWNIVGSFDALYTRALNQFILEDVNLVPGGHSLGEGGRQLYGTLSSTSSSSTPRRVTSNPSNLSQTSVRDVLRQFNSNRDWSVALTAQLNKRFSNGMDFTASYTWSRSMDIFSGTSDISNSNLNFASLDGTFANRTLTRSFWDVPSSIRISGSADLPYGFRFSLFYTGESGRPFAYRYNSDVNGDGFSGNDLFYVPLNAQDISLRTPSDWATLDAFINSQKCLREQRGRIMERNSCRNPWRSFVDTRLTKTVMYQGRSVELQLSMFNTLAFLGVGGKYRETTGFENVGLLSRTGYSTAMGRGIYSLALPTLNQVSVGASRWKMELGARLAF